MFLFHLASPESRIIKGMRVIGCFSGMSTAGNASNTFNGFKQILRSEQNHP
jgi:hypothetical protein